MSALLDEVLAAHGGTDRWREVRSLSATLTCGGVALATKGRGRALREVRATVDAHEPHVAFDGLGTFRGGDPRPPRMARRLRWTTADVVHFAGYALWGYVTAPFCFLRPGAEVEELPGRRLAVVLPADVPVHCRRQVHVVGDDGRLRSVHYTAEVFGPWARADNRVLRYETVGGVAVAVRRRVTPRGLPLPTLVSIALDEVRVTEHPAPGDGRSASTTR